MKNTTRTHRNAWARWWIFALMLMMVKSSAAQDPTFTAFTDKSTVAMGEQFEVTFKLDGGTGGRNFRPPSFNNFLPLSGPNQSTNMQFINGAMSASISYSYILQPRSEGTFTIGPASIELGGKELRTKPISVTVTKGAPAGKRAPQGQADGDADIAAQIADNLFIKVNLDKSRVYQGEQLTATYKIYTRVNLANMNLTKTPALTGFWSEDLEVVKQIDWKNEVVNGRQFRVGVLKRVALFPQRAGVLSIDPIEVDCAVQVQTRRRSNDIFDLFNDPFFGGVRNVPYALKSQAASVTVLPLPEEGIPAGFGGAVGKYAMETWLDKRETKANEAVTLKVKISGRGNLKLLNPPAILFPPDIESYDPKISENIARQGNVIAGSRTFEYLLVPRHAGTQKIQPFPFSYFDVEKKSYVTLTSPEFMLAVARGSDAASTSVSGISKEDVRLLGEDIRFIKSGVTKLGRRGERWVGSLAFYAFSISPVVAFVGFVLFARRRRKLMGDVIGVRNRGARKMARRRLAEARKFLDQKKTEEFYSEVSRALWGYASDKLSIPRAELSTESVRASLLSKGAKDETVGKFLATIEQCEFARFAPSADASGLEDAYSSAVNLLSEIEDQVR